MKPDPIKPDAEFPIEPLTDAAWKRIEQVVFAELDSAQAAESAPPRPRFGRAARIAWIGAPLAAAAAALLIWSARSTETAAPLASRRLVTAAEATATRVDGASVRVEPASAVVLVETAGGGAFVAIERGAANFSVPKRRGRPAFVVQAGDVRVEVVGTRFRVARVGGSAQVEAYEGRVRVSAGGRSALLQRGDRWPAPDTTPALSVAPPPSEPAPAQPPAPALRGDGPRQRFEQAARLEAADPLQALRLYRSLARESGPWAENALYAAGRLELERGQRASARRLLARYLDRYPDGVNASDARSLIDRMNRAKERTSP